jgi:hypothetical protein
MENNQCDLALPTALNLDDPKNQLQYQLYKVTLAVEVFVEALKPALNHIAESINKAFTPIVNGIIEYERLINLGANENPHVAYLATHAKTRRAKKKNLKRLYKLGRKMKKRGAPYDDR